MTLWHRAYWFVASDWKWKWSEQIFCLGRCLLFSQWYRSRLNVWFWPQQLCHLRRQVWTGLLVIASSASQGADGAGHLRSTANTIDCPPCLSANVIVCSYFGVDVISVIGGGSSSVTVWIKSPPEARTPAAGMWQDGQIVLWATAAGVPLRYERSQLPVEMAAKQVQLWWGWKLHGGNIKPEATASWLCQSASGDFILPLKRLKGSESNIQRLPLPAGE